MWNLHGELLWDSSEAKFPQEERKFNKVSDSKKIEQLVLIKNHTASTFHPKYLADHRVSSPDRKEKKCNIHHVKPISSTTAFTSAFEEFQKSVTKEGKNLIR